jgi:hypothetical protein
MPSHHFVVAVCRAKEAESRDVKHWETTLVLLAALSASVALSDDFKTVNGKEYKDATVTRVEPDGIVLKSKSGISKVYFVELPKEVQERFHYNAANVDALRKQQATPTSPGASQSIATSGIEGLSPITVELTGVRIPPIRSYLLLPDCASAR